MNKKGTVQRGSDEEVFYLSLARYFKREGMDPEVIAETLYLWGLQQCSMSCIDEVTFYYGYGNLDRHESFEFPLPYELDSRTIWDLEDAFRYEKGQRVNEPRFGEGSVLSASENGDVTVKFDLPDDRDHRVIVVSMFSLTLLEKKEVLV